MRWVDEAELGSLFEEGDDNSRSVVDVRVLDVAVLEAETAGGDRLVGPPVSLGADQLAIFDPLDRSHKTIIVARESAVTKSDVREHCVSYR